MQQRLHWLHAQYACFKLGAMAVRRLLRGLKWKQSALRKVLANRKSRYLLRRCIRSLHYENEPIKVVIGAASTEYEDWISTDYPVLDALNLRHWNYLFERSSIDRILAEHVIEHWTEDEFRLFLKVVLPFLREQGFIRLAIPDGFHPDQSYIDWVKPGGIGIGADDHKILYNHIMITHILSDEGYGCNLMEYFDEEGQFHCSPCEISDGFVARSADNDPRNKERSLSYTSLIVDAWPMGGIYGL